MKKPLVYTLILLVTSSLILTTAPSAFSQPQNIQILSYSHYIDSLGYLTVVGEIQNTGPNIIASVIVTGAVTSSDGVEVTSGARVWGANLLPNQKAPFYMDFASQSTSDGKWYGVEITDVTLSVYQATPTAEYQYQDLKISNDQGTVAVDGVFWVNGKIQNIGSWTAQNVTVVATYYNSAGTVVGVGYTNHITLTPNILSPSATATFKVGAFDRDQNVVPASDKIVSYSLLFQVLEPILQGEAPVLSETPTPPPITIESPATAEGDQTLTYIALAAAAAIAIIAGLVLLKKRQSKPVAADDKPARRTKPARRNR